MQQQERLSLADSRDMETRAIRFDGQMFDPIGIHRKVSIEESAASYSIKSIPETYAAAG